MVMSTSARDPRQRCMRCGSDMLRALGGGTLLQPSLGHFSHWPATNVTVQHVIRQHESWTKDLIGEGSHI
jgi:hypothetical protein